MTERQSTTSEVHDEWLARLDHYLELTRPADELMTGAMAFYAALPHLPIQLVGPRDLRDLVKERSLEHPETYRHLVDLHPAEIGCDGEYRYALRDQRDPLGDPLRDGLLSDRSDSRRAGPGADCPSSEAARRSSLPGDRSPARPDALDLITARLSLAKSVVRARRRMVPVDLIEITALDGYVAGLEAARLYLTAQLGSRGMR